MTINSLVRTHNKGFTNLWITTLLTGVSPCWVKPLGQPIPKLQHLHMKSIVIQCTLGWVDLSREKDNPQNSLNFFSTKIFFITKSQKCTFCYIVKHESKQLRIIKAILGANRDLCLRYRPSGHPYLIPLKIILGIECPEDLAISRGRVGD